MGQRFEARKEVTGRRRFAWEIEARTFGRGWCVRGLVGKELVLVWQALLLDGRGWAVRIAVMALGLEILLSGLRCVGKSKLRLGSLALEMLLFEGDLRVVRSAGPVLGWETLLLLGLRCVEAAEAMEQRTSASELLPFE